MRGRLLFECNNWGMHKVPIGLYNLHKFDGLYSMPSRLHDIGQKLCEMQSELPIM